MADEDGTPAGGSSLAGVQPDDAATAPDEELEGPSDMPGAGIEDDSGFLEVVLDDDDPLLQMDEGTRVGLGGPE